MLKSKKMKKYCLPYRNLRVNNMERELKELGIEQVGTYAEDGSYVIDIDTSEEFGKTYSTLD